MSPVQRLLQAVAIVALAVAALIVTLGVYGYGLIHGHETRALLPLRVRPDAALLARGRHLAEVSCVGCHSADNSLPLAGGPTNFLHESGRAALGELYAPNLTPAGRLPRYGDPELGRAIREGIAIDRRPMLAMPSADFRGLSDRDLAALITYLRSQPAVAAPARPRRISPLACLLLGMQAIETSLQRPVEKPVPTVPEGATPEYGEYLTGFLGCADCHGADFRGGRSPLAPRGPDLLPAVTRYPEAVFRRALREGVSPTGRTLDSLAMPWPVLSRLKDIEIAAVYQFLRRQTGAMRPGS